MKKQIDQVVEFNSTAGYKKATLENEEVLKLKLNLINEELEELIYASSKQDKVEILDALGDLLYVIYGYAYTFDLENVLEKAFERIHQSNMTKFCISEEEAIKSVENYKNKDVETYYKKVNDKYVIYRSSDNKVLKNINYKPVKLEDLI